MSDSLGSKMSSKIVSFDFENDRLILSKLNALPDVVRSVHEQSQITLMQKLKTYFDRVDDALFESADKAFSSQDQNVFFDAMRELRVQRQGIEKRFIAAVSHAFIDLLHASDACEPSYADTVTCDALSLVGNDDLEEMVALDTSVSNANNHYGESIQHISLRLDSLLPVKIYQKNNPLGPNVLCQIFMTQVKRLDIDLKAKLIVFKLFDRILISDLDNLYKAINTFMIDSNILPSLSAASTRRQGRSSAPSQNSATGLSESGLTESDEQQFKHTSAPAESTAQHGVTAMQSGVSLDVLNALQSMFSSIPNPQMSESSSAFHLLSKVQGTFFEGRGGQKAGEAGHAQDLNGFALVDYLHVASNKHGQINASENQIVHLVAMLFDFVLEDESITSQLKSLIIKLQIPFTKLALIDKTFLINNRHPARQLLNTITQSAICCEPDNINSKQDPLYQKIKDVIALLLTQFDDDVAIFKQALNEFEAYTSKEERRARLLEKRTLDAEDGKAKAEVARLTIDVEIELRIVDKKLPKVVVVIIEKAWRNYLFITALKYGFDTLQWRSAITAMDDLILSVQPLKNDMQRSSLIHLAPGLLKKLQHGFDAISYNPYETAKIFKVLEHVHLKLIRGKDVDVFIALRSAAFKRGRTRQEIKPLQQNSLTDSNVQPKTKVEKQDKSSSQSEPLKQLDLSAEVKSGDKAFDHKYKDIKGVSKKEREGPMTVEVATSLSNTVDSDVIVQPIAQDIFNIVEGFSQGAWFEMYVNDTTIARCRLAAYIKPTDKYIFVNRNGMKVTEKTKYEFALAIKDKKMREINNTVLFDRALEAVVSSMRKKNSNTAD